MSNNKTYQIKKNNDWERIAEGRLKHIKALVDVIGKLGFYPHAHDEDCPKCGFPETSIIREGKTHKPIIGYCSKCGWSKKFRN